ncbi:hypothetical protein NQ176_g812 [Zarea fungicola]|uniref:Uncharacterized protein n=1 Tax=Zarea fungicola TaxID=93591 RepID=A0ACC1NVF0_9HYPO|nr:hypothetical protein NQ176_g812 [Lecanicillium fungicola]
MANPATILSLMVLLGFVAATQTCCADLQQALGTQVSFPDQFQYQLTESSYNALQEADLKPTCILRPNTANDVARAVSILSTPKVYRKCHFAIKGGGHNAGIGFANINDGVTIDMASLSSVSLSSDQTVALVGAGGKWVDVYAYLNTFNLTVAGGRNGNVGVGGLLVGGGISHFSPRVGWACDNVVNFEVVLGNGSLVSANPNINPDLYLALKGGANNLGVVTRFDLATFPQGNISSTLLVSDGSQAPAILKAFTDITTRPEFDIHTSLVTTPIYNSETKAWSIINIAVYTEPVENPPVFAELFSIPNLSRQITIGSVSAISNETERPASNTLFATATFKPSLQLMLEMFDIMDKYFSAFTAPSGSVQWVVGFEPLVAGLIQPSRGVQANLFGLDSKNIGFILLLSPTWSDAASTDAVQEAAREVLGLLETHAESRGLLQKFQYLNYAAPYQQPLESFGGNKLQFLRKVSSKYDSGRVFQDQVPGGFKLWQ